MSARPLKILHVLDSLAVGGLERVVLEVANGLDCAEFQQTVCCLSRAGALAAQLRPEVRCLDLGKGAQADRLMPLKLARVFRQEQPDIIHTQSWSGVDAALARIFVRPPRLVHSEHGRHVPYLQQQPWVRQRARRWLYEQADAVFAVSDEVRAYYCCQTGFPAARMQVIANGVDVRRIAAPDKSGVRREWGIADNDFVIGTVARFDATKDLFTLARAFALLRANHPQASLKLLLVGDGAERPLLEAFAAEHGLQSAVIFTGMQAEVPRLLGALDVFALSSVSEGMPLTVLEAMAAGLPVVATNVGALPELVVEGQTGWLMPPQQPAALAEALARFVTQPALGVEFGAAGRQRVARQFSLDAMLQRYADLYRTVHKEKGRSQRT